jgi:hypothetical protein
MEYQGVLKQTGVNMLLKHLEGKYTEQDIRDFLKLNKDPWAKIKRNFPIDVGGNQGLVGRAVACLAHAEKYKKIINFQIFIDTAALWLQQAKIIP